MGYSIQPVTIWVNGQSKTANYIIARSIYDDLNTEAIFYYQLTDDQSGSVVTDGNVTMSGQDYIDWDASADINLAAYEYLCEQLNLILV